ncbi:MAG TPA: trypsin-like peptidase domain-containing protein [Nitrososphaeraceae archaeon]|nr:trypsin-like peptidase domain-containing protein [Nitrososphaeraceae archaeon]
MNNILVRLPDHTSNRILSLLSVTLTISVGLVLVCSTLQVENFLKFAEAQIANNTIGGAFGYNNNKTSAILESTTHNAARNVTVQDLTLPELFERVEKSVVQVTTTSGSDQLDLFRSGIGSGFVYNNDGLIVTNYHVIAPSVLSSESVREETNNGVDINVAFEDGTIYPATLVGADRFSDIAIIDVPEDARDRLVPLPVGNSSELRVGQQVVAIGNPFGLSGSMTEGIVSGLGRLIPSSEEEQVPPLPDGIPVPPPRDPSIPGLPQQPPGDEPPQSLPPTNPDEELRETQRRGSFSIPDVIQTDAPINPGNSGGPLLDLRGEVIGMNTAIFSSTGESAGVGFAIPSNTLKKVVPALISSGMYQHPWLGISGTDVTPEIAEAVGLKEAKGFLVTDITSESPADRAGIRGGYKIDNIDGREIALGGDIIIAIDNNTVRKIDDILSYLEREKNVGDQVRLTVLREGNITQTFPTTLAARPGSVSLQQSSPQEQQQQQNQGKPAWLGISGISLTPEVSQAIGLTPDTRGFLVIEVAAGGPADKAGIRGGYKIENIDGREIALGGDIIVGIDNTTVTSLENILTYLSNEKQAGDKALLNVIRDGRSSQINVTLGEIPQSDLQGRQEGEQQQPELEIVP